MPNTVHLINPLTNANGGSEWHTLTLFEILAEYTEVNLWTEFKADPSLTGRYPIRAIDPQRGIFPRGGNLVFIGVYFAVTGWVRSANPNRSIVFFNTPDPERLKPVVESLRSVGLANIEVAYQAETHQAMFPQYPGPVHASPISLELFRPEPTSHEGFVVGRYSRDHPEKHHADDPELYRRLAHAGCEVRIMGGLSQREKIGDDRVQLLPAGAVPPYEFLSGLDCFLYRVREDLYEAFGRVVAEAMACGVPVVAEGRGGYVDFVENGRNGFLFKDNDQALAQVLALRDDPSLRAEIGLRGRQTVEEMYSPENVSEMAEFYYR
jgi:glycosyltransferase involved in cell wall biosynthesis